MQSGSRHYTFAGIHYQDIKAKICKLQIPPKDWASVQQIKECPNPQDNCMAFQHCLKNKF
jgi:hypothetical protein